MARVDHEVVLAHDVTVLRELIDRLLDAGRGAEDPVLLAATDVLRDKLAELGRSASD